MRAKEQSRLQARVAPEIRKSLKLFCAQNDLTIQQAVELAIKKMCCVNSKEKRVSDVK